MGIVAFINIASLAFLVVLPSLVARERFRSAAAIEGARRSYAAYCATRVFAQWMMLETVLIPIAWHALRLVECYTVCESTLLIVILALTAAPAFIAFNLVLPLLARFIPDSCIVKVRLPILSSAAFAALWLIGRYTFRFLPLFASEARVQRIWLDNWLP